MNIEQITKNLINKDGIWFSEKTSEISYPEDGNMSCYNIENNSYWFNHRNECIINAVKKYSPNDMFFDIGGGNGFTIKGLEENNVKCVLIEPGINGVKNAKSRGVKNIICSTLHDLKLNNNVANAVGIFDVLEHIENDKLFLENIHNFLKINGLIYITVPSYNFLWSKEDSDAGHYKRYTINNLSKLLNQQGFKVEYSTYLFSFLILPILFFRTIPSILKIGNKTNNQEKDHSLKKGLISNIINKLLKKELQILKQNGKILFGTSCFIIAKKI